MRYGFRCFNKGTRNIIRNCFEKPFPMILKQKNGVPFFQFPRLASFSNDVRHGVFTRNGGCSRPPYQSMNISYDVGDGRDDVGQNRNIISECMEGKELVFAHQVHATDVLVFSGYEHPIDGNGSRDSEKRIGDAMVTDLPKKFLAIQVADCQSILMFDPVRRVVANVHSGWRGSTRNVIGRTIEVMSKRFGCRPCDIIAGIGPSLGPCCAEFINYRTEIPDAFWRYKDDSDHFDFWAISRDQLCNAGVLIENIDSSRLCTRCNTDLFFSYRKEGVTGRIASVIGLK